MPIDPERPPSANVSDGNLMALLEVFHVCSQLNLHIGDFTKNKKKLFSFFFGNHKKYLTMMIYDRHQANEFKTFFTELLPEMKLAHEKRKKKKKNS